MTSGYCVYQELSCTDAEVLLVVHSILPPDSNWFLYEDSVKSQKGFSSVFHICSVGERRAVLCYPVMTRTAKSWWSAGWCGSLCSHNRLGAETRGLVCLTGVPLNLASLADGEAALILLLVDSLVLPPRFSQLSPTTAVLVPSWSWGCMHELQFLETDARRSIQKWEH